VKVLAPTASNGVKEALLESPSRRGLSLNRRLLVAGVLLSFLVGFAHVYPDLRFIVELGPHYRGIGLSGATDELVYLGRINNAVHLKGPWTLSGVYNIEHRDSPWFYGFVGEWFTALICLATGLTPTQADILLTFLLPVLVFWLIALLVWWLTDSWRIAWLWSALIVFGYYFLTANPGVLGDLVQGRLIRPLWLVRPISPQFNYVLLILGLILAFKSVVRDSWPSAVGAGVVFGILVYTFFYHWTFLSVGVGVLGLIGLLRGEGIWAKKALVIVGITAVLSIPYWINLWSAIQSPNYAFLAQRNGVIVGRASFFPPSYIVGSLFVTLVLGSRIKPQFWFIIAFLIGGLICLNQQVVTGSTLQPGHWQNYSLKTFLIIALAPVVVRIEQLFQKSFSNKVSNLLLVLGIGFFFVLGLWQQNLYYKANWKKFASKQSIASVMGWLNDNTKPESVVLTDPLNEMKGEIPTRLDVLAYSHNYVYLPPYSDTLISKQEFEDRYLTALSFFGHSDKSVYSFFKYKKGVFFYGMSALAGYGGEPLSSEYIDYLQRRYSDLRSGDPSKALTRYRVDYVLVRARKAQSILENLPQLHIVFDDGQYVLFKVS
jgi:hypothetical protein